MEVKVSFLFLATFHLFAFSHGEYSDCGSKLGTAETVTVTNCDANDDKCTLHKNSNVTIQIKFTPKQVINKLNAVVHGIIMDVPVPFPLPNEDGCKDSGVTCPLQADVSYTYYTTLPVLKSYPPVSVNVKFELQNENNEDVTCTSIPSKIK